MTTNVTRRYIRETCNSLAHDLVPELPSEVEYHEWEAYDRMLEHWDTDAAARNKADDWEWCAHLRYGVYIVEVMTSDELADAEAQWYNNDAVNAGYVRIGVLEFALQVARIFLISKLTGAMNALIAERRARAHDEMDDMEEAAASLNI